MSGMKFNFKIMDWLVWQRRAEGQTGEHQAETEKAAIMVRENSCYEETRKMH